MKVVKTFWDARKEVEAGANAVYGRNWNSNDFLYPRFLIAETEEEAKMLSEFLTNDEFADQQTTDVVYANNEWITPEEALVWFQRNVTGQTLTTQGWDIKLYHHCIHTPPVVEGV